VVEVLAVILPIVLILAELLGFEHWERIGEMIGLGGRVHFYFDSQRSRKRMLVAT
jgi:hypothetical protein